MKNLNILSINGGGIRGLIALKQLVKLEEICGMKLNEKFQLISGTSTGGIIAVMLADGRMAKELLDIYTKHGSKIFDKRFLRFGLFGPKYDSTYFEKVIFDYVGDKRLSDIKIDITIPACNETTGEVILFKSRKAREDSAHDFLLRDVIRATASAPYFFKAHEIYGEYYVDGGMAINNPSLITAEEAEKCNEGILETDKVKINCISFSTGSINHPFTKETASGGLLKWANRSLDMLLKNQDKMTDYFMKKRFERAPGIYMRCDSLVDKSDGSIDNAHKKNIDNMLIDGENSAYRNSSMMRKFHVETLN